MESVLGLVFGDYGIWGFFLLLCALLVALWILFWRQKPGSGILSATHLRQPPENLVIDPKARNAVLKQRFLVKKVPENLDAIVIGSGISGLTTAVLLGRAGQKVLVLEQHDQAGGTCHTFIEKGYEFDTGIHYVGEMSEGDLLRVLCDQVTEGQVTWIPLAKDYDRITVGTSGKYKRYQMISGTRAEFVANLEKQFPDEKEAIAKCIDLIEESLQHYLRLPLLKVLPLTLAKMLVKTKLFHTIFSKFTTVCKTTVKEALDKITDNEELKNIMTYIIYMDVGVRPDELVLPGYAWIMNHFWNGGFYPLGGPSEIAFQIIPIIERYGGRVLVDAPVTSILVDDTGRANGVTIHRGSGDVNVYARYIISDVGVKNTFKFMLPRQIAEKSPVNQVLEKVGPSMSWFSVFIGLNGTSEELGLHAGNTFAFSGANFDKVIQDYLSVSLEEAADMDCPFLFLSFPSAKDPSSWAQKYPGKSCCLILTFAHWSWYSQWQGERVMHREETYKALKEKIGRQMWQQAMDIYPKLKGKADYIEFGTPLSSKYYLGQAEGELYGLSNGKTKFLPENVMYLRPESGIPGLYLTGQDILHDGFAPCLSAGLLTASAILNRNLLKDLTNLTENLKMDKEKKLA